MSIIVSCAFICYKVDQCMFAISNAAADYINSKGGHITTYAYTNVVGMGIG